MIDIEKKSACDECPGDNLPGTCASIKELGRCGQELRRKAIAEYESLPKIHGWVARDSCGYLGFYMKKPILVSGFWQGGYLTNLSSLIGKDCFPELTPSSEPIEVELLIRKK